MRIAIVIAAVLLAAGYLGFRVIEYVTAVESAHRLVIEQN